MISRNRRPTECLIGTSPQMMHEIMRDQLIRLREISRERILDGAEINVLQTCVKIYERVEIQRDNILTKYERQLEKTSKGDLINIARSQYDFKR